MNYLNGTRRLLMCRPEFLHRGLNENPWSGRNAHLAMKQWDNLKLTLEQCGAKIEVMNGIGGLPDMIFTANAGFVHKDRIYLSYFQKKSRQPERHFFKKWFQENGYAIHGDEILAFQGEGEALVAGKKLFGSYGFRTNPEVFTRFQKELFMYQVITCKLIHPNYYHLNRAFCPLSADLALWYPYAFSEKSRQKMENQINLLEVPEKEAENQACASVVIGSDVIMPFGNPQTAAMVERHGMHARQVDVDEFTRAGGGCKAMTLSLDHI